MMSRQHARIWARHESPLLESQWKQLLGLLNIACPVLNNVGGKWPLGQTQMRRRRRRGNDLPPDQIELGRATRCWPGGRLKQVCEAALTT